MIRSSEEFKRAYWTPVFKDEWISKWTPPNRHIKDEEEVIFDGIRYTVHDIGAGGDSDSNSIWIIENEPRVRTKTLSIRLHQLEKYGLIERKVSY